MILYFSGTGNSRFVATELGKLLKLEAYPLAKAESFERLESSDDVLTLFVFPTYSWGVPPVVLDFIEKMSTEAVSRLSKGKVIAVATCGDETAMTPEMLSISLHARGLRLYAFYSVIMPNNYVLLPGFDVDPKNLEESKLKAAPQRIHEIADKIKCCFSGLDITRGSWPRLKTSLVYPLFKRFGIYPSKWKSTDDCISCGRCAEVCPVGNIRIRDGRPRWGADCTSCLGCYHVCPRHAVRYAKATRRKGQYFLKIR